MELQNERITTEPREERVTFAPEEKAKDIISLSDKSYTIVIASFILVILCVFFLIYRLTPPDAQPATAPLEEFASGRAKAHLRQIAMAPHPIGSTENFKVRDYILKELTDLGLSPEVQKSLVIYQQRGGSYVAASVQNIIGGITGADSRKAVLLACHYDSVPTGPGASDDGVSVAALLEVMRALKRGPALKNDVLFLFTDGEELGMLGARAFMDEHPRAKDVAVVFNFEARGIDGPSIMFETSEGNEWLIKEFAEIARRPVANSLTYDLYKLLPNSTDLTIFKNGGLRGLNFAYIGGVSSYHTARDRYENIDERSLQHHGSYALALARRFGNMSSWPLNTSDAVYFDLFSAVLVHYPGSLVLPLMTLGLALFVGLLAIGLRMNRLTIRGIAFGAFGFLLNVIGAGAAVMLTWLVIQRMSSNPVVGRDNINLYAAGFLSLTIALTTLLFIWLRKKTKLENLAVGALFWWAVVMVLLCLRFPGGSYLFTWPLLFTLATLSALFILREDLTSTRSVAALTLSALPGVILIAPLICLVIAGFGMGAVGPVMILAVFLLAHFYPHLNLFIAIKKWQLPLFMGVLGFCLLSAGIFTDRASAKHPKWSHLLYALNADTMKAIWGSVNTHTDEWTSQFFSSGAERANLSEHFVWARGAFLRGDAPALPLTPPSVVLVEDKTEIGLRTVRLRVTSPRKAPVISVYWKQKLELESLAVNGKQAVKPLSAASGASAEYRRFSYSGLPDDGIELSLRFKSAGPLEIRVEDWSYGLPEVPLKSYKRRPDHLIAAPFACSDCTIVMKSATF